MVDLGNFGCHTTTMIAHPTPFEALRAALTVAGSQSALARVCGVSSTAVWKWVQSSKRLPAEYVLLVEAATGVSRHFLRPDIYPPDPHRLSALGTDFASLSLGAEPVSCGRRTISQRRNAA